MIDKIISEVFLFNDVLHIMFTNGSGLSFEDDGHCCCEKRYMCNDGDDLREYVGAKYINYSVKDGPDVDADYECHEVQFLEIMTSVGAMTLSMHNEHNGYYGGFHLRVVEIPTNSDNED